MTRLPIDKKQSHTRTHCCTDTIDNQAN